MMDKDTKRLVQHFRNVDVYEGQRGDLDNASPGQSAIRVMVERKQKILELELERDNLKADVKALDSAIKELRRYPAQVLRLQRATTIIAERDRQDAKWGIQDHSLPVWVTILMEEVGELAAAALGHTFGTDKHPDLDWRKEAVQVAAVALAMLEQYKLEENDD